MRTKIHIALAADAAYLQHAAAMLASLLHWHHPQDVSIHYMLDDDISARDMQTFEQWLLSCGPAIERVSVPQSLCRDLPRHPRFGKAAWFRLLLPELLPDLSRVLYLDCDIIINESLDQLWATDIGEAPLAAVHNPLHPHISPEWIHRLGIPHVDRYFNSGVLLMDLSRMRSQGLVNKMVLLAAKIGQSTPYPDQDVLNQILWDEWHPLRPKYNAQHVIFEIFSEEMHFDRAEIRQARNRPVIIHFSGRTKPWHDVCGHRYKQLYWRHLDQTPWTGALPEERHWLNPVMRRIPFRLYYWRAVSRQYWKRARRKLAELRSLYR